jgi:hypothetical protein
MSQLSPIPVVKAGFFLLMLIYNNHYYCYFGAFIIIYSCSAPSIMLQQDKFIKFLYIHEGGLILFFKSTLVLFFLYTILFLIFCPIEIIKNIANVIAFLILRFLINIIISRIEIDRDICTDTFRIILFKQSRQR